MELNMTTKHNQQEREKYANAAAEVGKKIEAAYAKAEEKSDDFVDDSVSILQKLKEKKWTAAAIVSVGIGVALMLIR
jgi:thymidylate synthase